MPPKRPDGKPPRAPRTNPRQTGGPSQFYSVDREATDNTLRRSLEGRRAVKEVTADLAKEGFAPPGRRPFGQEFNPRPDSPFHRDNWKQKPFGQNVSDPLKGKQPETLEERTQARLRERRQSRDDERQGEDIRRILSGRLGAPPDPWLHPTVRAKKARDAAVAAAHAAAGNSDEEIEPAPEFDACRYGTKPSDPSVVWDDLPEEPEDPIEPEPEFESAPLVYRANIVPHLRGLPGVVTKPNIDSYFGDSYGPLPSTGFNRAYDLIAQAKHGVTKTSPGMPFPFGASSHASSRRMYRRKPSLVAKDLQNRLDACEIKLSYLLDELSEHINDLELKSVKRELGKIELETVGFILGSGGDNGNDSDTLSESD